MGEGIKCYLLLHSCTYELFPHDAASHHSWLHVVQGTQPRSGLGKERGMHMHDPLSNSLI